MHSLARGLKGTRSPTTLTGGLGDKCLQGQVGYGEKLLETGPWRGVLYCGGHQVAELHYLSGQAGFGVGSGMVSHQVLRYWRFSKPLPRSLRFKKT